jgi:hypothetical protein
LVRETKGNPSIFGSSASRPFNILVSLPDTSASGEVNDAVEADYTFTVELDGRRLKLEYNKGENPYIVAQKFIERHDLGQNYLEDIASFITSNAQVRFFYCVKWELSCVLKYLLTRFAPFRPQP